MTDINGGHLPVMNSSELGRRLIFTDHCSIEMLGISLTEAIVYGVG